MALSFFSFAPNDSVGRAADYDRQESHHKHPGIPYARQTHAVRNIHKTCGFCNLIDSAETMECTSFGEGDANANA
jgi:hypothetical protein